MSERIALFNRRFIPNEITYLRDDEIVAYSDEMIATRWKKSNPREDFARAESRLFRKKGVKVSKVFNAEGRFSYWYCDIVEEAGAEGLDVDRNCVLKNGAAEFIMDPDEAADVIVINDLLADVVIFPSGEIRILDLDELAEAYDKGMISDCMLKKALRTTNDFTRTLYERLGHMDIADDRFVIP